MMSEPIRSPRPAARILLVDGRGRALLFRFTPADRPPFWVTPGGALEPGESYENAARRELFEETGIDSDPGEQVARRLVDFVSIEGVPVTADERYFRVEVSSDAVDPVGHTQLERQVMQSWRWFTREEIELWAEPIYPADLGAMLAATDAATVEETG